jgi:hypothetical protein
MSRWFRFYAAAIRHPKVARLADKDFRLWCELLSVAAENDGKIPPLDDLKHLLNRRLDYLKAGVERLLNGGLIDQLGDGYEPHGWKERQYKSDTSTERVRKHRRYRNVSVTPPDTETETEVSVAKATGASADPDRDFWRNAKAYLGPYVGGDAKAGSLIGKWCKGGRQPETARAISAAQVERAVDPVAYVEASLRRPAAVAGEIW